MEPTKTKNQKAASILTINGKTFDATKGTAIDPRTGKPLPKTRHYGSFDVRPSASVHAGPSRSKTLRRTGLAKPQTARPLAARHVRSVTQVPTHPAVSRFGRPAEAAVSDRHVVHPNEVLSAVNTADAADRPVMLATQVQNYSPAAKIVRPAKQAAASLSHKITEHAVKHAPTRAQKRKGIFKTNDVDREYARLTRVWKKISKHVKLTPPVIVSGVILLVLAASVICYLTVPALSLYVAAKSANVEATYPGYIPAGYHFKGPVTYSEGKVTMRFAAAGSDSAFTIEQNSTYWDSGAVLDNYVLARSQNYLTYSQGGITIYTFGSQAAWVNAGVLHTIDGNAQLTSDQILRIAGSM